MLRYACLALAMVSVTATHSSAKWREQYGNSPPAIQAWYRAQKNEKGELCCDHSDGHPYFGNYRLTEDGGVELQLEGGPYKIPPYMVLLGPNPTGHAVWWYIENEWGHMDICFAAGALN